MLRVEVTMPVVEAALAADLETAIEKVREELQEVIDAKDEDHRADEIADVAVAAFGMLIGQLGVEKAQAALSKVRHKLYKREHFDPNYGRVL